MHTNHTFAVLTTLGVLLTLCACADHELAVVTPRQSIQQGKEIPLRSNRELDLLFVIDNSSSMAGEQNSLAANFPVFVGVLETLRGGLRGGLPGVRIGVISTDMGGQSNDVSGCGGTGDGGALLTGNCGLTQPYLESLGSEDGQARVENFGGTLADNFACMAKLGVRGCGLEQPLESMRRALEDGGPNAGFLRPDAYLAVIFISDEDDCSANGPELFDPNNAALGPMDSFRCFEYGVTCDLDADPRAAGTRERCISREDSSFTHSVASYVEFLKSRKSSPELVFVAGIVGNAAPVSVRIGQDPSNPDNTRSVLDPSCSNGEEHGDAFPAVRLSQFIEQFGDHGTVATICNEDMSAALTQIARVWADTLEMRCMDGDLVLTSGEPTCVVSDVSNLHESSRSETVLPKCDAVLSRVPCYRFERQPQACAYFPTHLSLVVERGNTQPPRAVTVVAFCESN